MAANPITHVSLQDEVRYALTQKPLITYLPRGTSKTTQPPPLESVTSPNVGTNAAAYYTNRKPQTLRIWAMNQHPIRPLKINGRLAWPVDELRCLLGVTL